ncbi:hypothetical protein ALP17_200051 [Pseudomonas savastanoi]|uniref:Uncharacterized protein n=1 Tax=Pseudomonas savastanoi TaxID=29438 RepID=A0A3M6A9R5_PSESS|nr:hypothetical protein ALP17_200051 [Pseudomonas savastanoi]
MFSNLIVPYIGEGGHVLLQMLPGWVLVYMLYQ